MGLGSTLKAVKISDLVYWVGAIDWNIRDFHGYVTGRGSTYNAYLIVGEQVTLVDTVKAGFHREMLSRVSSIVDPREIKYLVSNHSEMDHTGSLVEVMELIDPDEVYASKTGVKTLNTQFDIDREIKALSSGDELELGGVKLSFLETRMLHWPDSMVTYLPEEKLLFSQDGFGMHLAGGERFADEIPYSILEEEAARYYANILLPYSNLVSKLIANIAELGIEINTLCPDHGPVWRKDIDKIIGLWRKWALQKPQDKAVVLYDSMWGSTALMSKAVAEGLDAEGIAVKVMPVRSSHRSEVALEILDAGAFLVGSPTLNNNIFPSVADVLTYLKGLKPKNLIGASFGSYGWSGESVKHLNEILDGMKVEIIDEGVSVNYVPGEEDLVRCYELGVKCGKQLKEITNAGK
ncbi:MAG: FprA family A-type flavoprotein [Actinobacteria bacterium]|nr:FprA family A-type flavoprotein [Actinomycetota bacterium]